jgi:hypothetical protein
MSAACPKARAAAGDGPPPEGQNVYSATAITKVLIVSATSRRAVSPSTFAVTRASSLICPGSRRTIVFRSVRHL